MDEVVSVYDPRVFRCRSSEEARSIILMPEAGLNTNERWERETEYLAGLIEWPKDTRLVIDYGCGIGRMAKAMKPAVLGVDMMPTMRAQGEGYLENVRQDCGFIPPVCLELLAERGLRAQGAMAIWALQHMPYPDRVVRLLFNCLPPGAPLYVVNRDNRCVPASHDGRIVWVDDGADMKEVVESGGFVLTHEEPMPETLCAPGAWFRRYERAAV
jgi:hypothetical protein